MVPWFPLCHPPAATTWNPLRYFKTIEGEERGKYRRALTSCHVWNRSSSSRVSPPRQRARRHLLDRSKDGRWGGGGGLLVWGGGDSGDRKKVSLKRRVQVHLFPLWCGCRRGFGCWGKSIELSSRKFTTRLSASSPLWKLGSSFLVTPYVSWNPWKQKLTFKRESFDFRYRQTKQFKLLSGDSSPPPFNMFDHRLDHSHDESVYSFCTQGRSLDFLVTWTSLLFFLGLQPFQLLDSTILNRPSPCE